MLIPQVFLILVLVFQNLNLLALLTAPRSKKQNKKFNSKFFKVYLCCLHMEPSQNDQFVNTPPLLLMHPSIVLNISYYFQ